MRTKRKFSWLIMLASLLAVWILSFGAAYAYFSDTIVAGGTFTLGKLQINLKDGSKTISSFASVEDILPGHFLLGDQNNFKSLTIDLQETSITSYLRVKPSANLQGVAGSESMFNITIDNGWFLHTDGYYYQATQGQDTTAASQANEIASTVNSVTLNVKIQFKTSVEGDAYMNKTATYGVIVEAIQADYLESTDPNNTHTISTLSSVWGWAASNPEDIFVITGGTMSGLTDYGKTLTYLNIPNGVTTISTNAFKNNKTLKTVVMDDSVETISGGAFQNCYNLQSVTLSNSTMSIGDYAFQGCKKLEEINIPSSVESIGTQAFYNCTNLNDVTLEDGVESIGYLAFGACTSLETIEIPDTVTTIGDFAFYTSGITEITIPSSVTSLGASMFMQCASLEKVTLPDGITSIPKQMFGKCTSLTNVNIPNTVTSIGQNAFAECTSLTVLTLPEGLTDIGNYAFSKSTQLNVNIPSTVKYIRQYAFQTSGIKLIDLPEGLLYIGDGAFNHCTKVNQSTITIPSTVLQIGGKSYTGNNVSVGTHIFYECATTKLTAFAVAAGNTNYKAVDGVLYSSNNKYLVAYPPAKTSIAYTILEGCEQLYECAFSRTHYLIDLTLATTLKLEYTDSFTVPSSFLNKGVNPLYAGVYKFTSIENYLINNSDNYTSINGIIYNKAGTKAIAVANRHWSIADGKKVLEFEDSCTVIGNVLSRNNDPKDSVSSEEDYGGHKVGGYPNIIKINANITEIDECALDYFNALVDLGVIIQLDAGNTSYTLSNNKLVKVS